MKKAEMDKEVSRFWAPIGITAGLSIFFFGIMSWRNHQGGSGTWIDIGFGVLLILIGFFATARYFSILKKS